VARQAAARTVDAVKVYGKGQIEVRALDAVTVEFAAGRYTAIMGPSGSGKSTLLHCVAGLDSLTSGQAFIGEADLSTLNDHQLTILRRDHVGFVFQAFNLDSRAGAEVLGFLRRAVDEMGQTIVMVTHDPIAASYADRIVFLADGRIVDEMHQPTAERVLERLKRFGE